MMIFTLHCDTCGYTVVDPGPAAADLDPDHAPGSEHEFRDCLLVQVGAERGDREATISRAAKAVRRIGRETGAKQLVVTGFSGFASPDRRLDPATARPLLTSLQERLAADGWICSSAPWGWEKAWRLNVHAGIWAQRVTWL